MIQLLEQFNQFLSNYPVILRGIAWLLLALGILMVIFLLFSLLLTPLMLMYNKVTDKNRSNVATENDHLLGELTERIYGDSVGEVMVINSGDARATYPARLYRSDDVAAEQLLPVGTQVLIIDFDQSGIALVAKNQSIIE
ncbi:hypothetical protein NRIC_36590 [Enterococcus florum]|uniref:Uncharacterized protein n=1 Tax=Enterococcus florum TaxID=2480627 RepID=A0A4P5PHG6_9ENTE|nr:hypothetical protein [Enterococcus florum]GCF95768.1 hypothetical protein NRIC_36590 [Enterococcus florum]